MDEETDNKFLWDRKAHKLLSASWRGLRFIKNLFLRVLFPITGLFALIWFLVRIIPKPSRATYPCQRVAFPLASAFVVWLLGIIGSVSAFKKAKFYLNRSRYIIAGFCTCVSVGFLWLSLNITNPKQAFADDPTPNSPIGVAKGFYPGRVVWIHDPNATDWDGPGDGHSWEPAHTNQHYVDDIVSRAICELTGQ